MEALDWWIIGSYLVAMLALAAWLGRRQETERDYYLGGGLPAPALATSILATQCSTNSLLGAPAFVGFAAGGGLLWLQYELAVPLAMLGLAVLFPAVHRSGVISVYAYLQQRLGRGPRLAASGCFLFFRGIATGVTVYGVASVLALVTDIPYVAAVALLMGVTVVYDIMGGMRAVVVSDVIQMLLLLTTVFIALLWLAPDLWREWDLLAQRSRPLLDDWGVNGASNFGFWPMLFGGVFLYMAYYGCDQSQAQRLLAASDPKALNRILLLNGLLRFPVVLAYCLLGLGLAAYALAQPDFIASLPRTAAGEANLNLVFPLFVLREFTPGLTGLAIVGLFAAAMSSIDSALNSLSASTLEDFWPINPEQSQRQRFFLSKALTGAWGSFAVIFSYGVEHIARTVLEAINKVSSMANGPLLALFVLAVLGTRAGSRSIVSAFGAGILLNLLLWRYVPQVSWLWWNLTGCAATLSGGLLAARIQGDPMAISYPSAVQRPPRSITILLIGAFVAILAVLVLAQLWL